MYGLSAEKSGCCREVAVSRGSTVFVFENFINRDLKISLDPGLNLLGLRVETCRPQGKFPLIRNNGSVKLNIVMCQSEYCVFHR